MNLGEIQPIITIPKDWIPPIESMFIIVPILIFVSLVISGVFEKHKPYKNRYEEK